MSENQTEKEAQNPLLEYAPSFALHTSFVTYLLVEGIDSPQEMDAFLNALVQVNHITICLLSKYKECDVIPVQEI